MSVGNGKSRIISVVNNVVGSDAAGVDLKFGEVVAIDQNGAVTDAGPSAIDPYAEVTEVPTIGVVTAANGIKSGDTGPVCVAGECVAYIDPHDSAPMVIGAWLNISTVQRGAGASATNLGALGFVATTVSTAHDNEGALANEANGFIYTKLVRARLINGSPAAATATTLAASSTTAALAVVEVFNNPAGFATI
jgi:hypothetical protein